METSSVIGLMRQQYVESIASWIKIADTLRTDLRTMDEAEFLIQRPVTKFVLRWMRELKRYQVDFGILMHRQKRPPIADDFTASIAFCLEQFLAARGYVGAIRCEKKIGHTRHAPRPDISVWSPLDENVLIAAIECKAGFGWKRLVWKSEFEQRAKQMKSSFPDIETGLIVLCQREWDNTEPNWICMSTKDPTEHGDMIGDADILNPLEPMFTEVLARVRSSVAAMAYSQGLVEPE